MDIKSQLVNGKRIYAFGSKDDFLSYISDKKKILIALNAEKLNKIDDKLDALINDNIGYPDGIGAVLALKRKGVSAVKIAGAEFWLDIISKYANSKSFYIIGATQTVIERTVVKLKEEFPGIQIKGYRDGFFKDGDKDKLIVELQNKKPDIVFVAQGSPRQEWLMSDLIDQHPALYMGLGGSFDVYTGLKKRAPKFYQRLGLEWFYRLLKEPTRFSRQISLLKFLIKIIFGRI